MFSSASFSIFEETMAALFVAGMLIILNISLNMVTRGRVASSGLDMVVPATILAAHGSGILSGILFSAMAVGAHFLSAQRNLHNAPIALITGCIAALGVGLLGGGSLQTATTVGLLLYHGSSAFIVYFLYRKIGARYILFVGINSIFSIFVLSFF